MKSNFLGNTMAAVSFLIWGLFPLYFQFMPSPPIGELLAIRLIASVPFALLLVIFIRKKNINWSAIWQDKKSLFYCFISSCLMSLSWCTFVWAMTNDRVIDASLGYFIGPLISIALGQILFKDKLSKGQFIAVCLAFVGVLYQIIAYSQAPIIALIMGLFFALYGLFKKKINFDWATSLFLEALLLTPFALIYLATKQTFLGGLVSTEQLSTFALYVGSAPITIFPLIFYSISIRYTTLTTIGLMQYIEPSIQFILAVFIFNEVFDDVKAVTFSLIWMGLLITIVETSTLHRKRRRIAAAI